MNTDQRGWQRATVRTERASWRVQSADHTRVKLRGRCRQSRSCICGRDLATAAPAGKQIRIASFGICCFVDDSCPATQSSAHSSSAIAWHTYCPVRHLAQHSCHGSNALHRTTFPVLKTTSTPYPRCPTCKEVEACPKLPVANLPIGATR